MANTIVEVTVVAPSEQPNELFSLTNQSVMNITAVLPDEQVSNIMAAEQDITIAVVAPRDAVPPSLAIAYVPVIGGPGPPGPPGPVGPDKNYLHVQNAATDTWIVNHNLGKFPSIEIMDSAGTVVYGAVDHIDNNTAIVSFSVPFGGTATCN